MFSSRTNWRLETNRFTQALQRHLGGGGDLYDLTNSNPTTCGFAYPEEEILAALSDRRALRYDPESKGLREAREAVCHYCATRPGFAGAISGVNPERIVLTSGTSEAYSHIFRLLCQPGDEILVPAPSYPLFDFLADLADLRLVPYPLLYDHGWFIDWDALSAAISSRSRAVVVVHPNNPTGSFLHSHEAARLGELCASREMAIVADEVFLDYSDGVASPTFAANAPALTFTLSGLSKVALLPQMKLAWLIVSGGASLAEEATARLEIIADTFLSPGMPVQLAAGRLLALGAGMREQARQRIQANLAYLDRLLSAPGPIARLEREGGWYGIVRVPSAGSDEDVAIALLERCAVLTHPGHFYNFSRDGFLVLSLIIPENEFQEGVRRLHGFFAPAS